MTDILWQFTFRGEEFAIHGFAIDKLPVLRTWCCQWARMRVPGVPLPEFDPNGAFGDILPTAEHLDALVHWAYTGSLRRLSAAFEWDAARRAADLLCTDIFDRVEKRGSLSRHLRNHELRWRLGFNFHTLSVIFVGLFWTSVIVYMWAFAIDRYCYYEAFYRTDALTLRAYPEPVRMPDPVVLGESILMLAGSLPLLFVQAMVTFGETLVKLFFFVLTCSTS